jgi:hypothetical protein
MTDLNQIITKEEVDKFKLFSGKLWDKNNILHVNAKKDFNLTLQKLELAVTDAAAKIWELQSVSIDTTSVLTQPIPDPSDRAMGKRGGGMPHFAGYLAARVGLVGKYQGITRYWIFIDGPRNDASIRLVLGIIDAGKSPQFRNHTTMIQQKYDLNKPLYIKGQMTLVQISEWIVDSVAEFKLEYDQFCSMLQPYLDKEIERLNKTKKDNHIEIGKNKISEYSSEKDNVNKNFFTKNIIYYGPPGTGKTYRLQRLQKQYENRCEFVTFHQSYGYEEFVEGLRPVLADDNGGAQSTDGSGQVRYKIEPGIFLELCQRATSDENNRYAIFIDEINRGNISKIFGELISLIEIDKREKLKIKLAYSKNPFTVPKNVDIIGTMNTADRSLALLDTALRRRFEFKALYPDTREKKVPGDEFSAPLSGLMVGEIDVREMLQAINNRIELLYDRDHCIGHTYFTELLEKEDELKSDESEQKRFVDLQNIFFKKIRPLLEEYFFENWKNIKRVLGDHPNKPKDLQFLHEISTSDDPYIFEDASEPERFRYRWNDDAFRKPEAYIRIYSNLKKQVSL